MYELNAFFWYKLLFTFELILAEALTVIPLKRRRFFVLRAVGAFLFCEGFAAAIPEVSNSVWWHSLVFFLIFAAVTGGLCLCFREKVKTVVFCSIAGYTAQHIAYILFEIFIAAIGPSRLDPSAFAGSNPLMAFPFVTFGSGQFPIMANPFTIMFYCSFYGITYFLYYKFVSRQIARSDNMQLRSTALFVLVVVILFVDLILSNFASYHAAEEFDWIYVILINLANLFCCLLALYVQFGVALVQKLETDLDIVNRLREQESAQYELMKKNIGLIDIKCHDLKHQIRKIGKKNVIAPEAIEEMENIISVYDSKVKTGNETLDVILTEKSLICNAEGISMSCIADGARLSFMSETDTYSLFGNLLDNAIEAVRALDIDERVITLSVKESHGTVFVNVYNRYRGDIRLDGGLPVTTKRNKSAHGYGMKSIAMTVEKYGGGMDVKVEGGVFNVGIVFAAQAPTTNCK